MGTLPTPNKEAEGLGEKISSVINIVILISKNLLKFWFPS